MSKIKLTSKSKYLPHFKVTNLENIFKDKISKVKSKGIDKISSENFKKIKKNEFKIIEKKITNNEYRFSPYLELLKTKGRDKYPRLISLTTIRDRIVLDIIKNILHLEFSTCVSKELPNSYIRKIKKYLLDNSKFKIYFLKTDIEKFYETINQKKLINKVKKNIKDEILLNLIEKAIKTPTVPSTYKKSELSKYSKGNKGVPQGLPISNILAHIYINNIDIFFKNNFSNIFYLRYVDDILILSNENLTPQLKLIKSKLRNIGLKLNKEKTLSGNLDNGIEFLGYRVFKNKISTGNKAINNQIKKIAAKFTWFKNGIEKPKTRPDWLINDNNKFKQVFLEELNEIITGAKSEIKNYGWLFYYLEIDDLTILYKIDNIINNMFKRVNSFKGKPPPELKKTARAYFEIKYNRGGNYITNYDEHDTIYKKRKFLLYRSQINPKKSYSDYEIESIYEWYKNKNLKNLEKDVGYGY